MDNISNIGKTTIAVGVAGALFLGYCFYFDHKRRSAPDFKRKLHEKRAARQKDKGSKSKSKLPNLSDHEAVQRYFLHEIQMGEALISQGDIDRGVEHLSNAVIVCGQPTQLLQVLQQTLPAEVFTLLIHRMRDYSNQLGGEGPPGGQEQMMLKLKEDTNNDDLE